MDAFGSGFCSAPRRVLKRMRKADPSDPGDRSGTGESEGSAQPSVDQEDWGGWVPKRVRSGLKSFSTPGGSPPVKIVVGKTQSLQKFLFTAWPTADVKDARVLSTAAAYRDGIDLIKLVDRNEDYLIYTLDCGGVLSAALQAGGGFGVFNLGSKLKTAARTSAARVVVRGISSSPLTYAVVGDQLLPLDLRLDVLGALLLAWKGAADDDKFSTIKDADLVTISRSDSESFQGEASAGLTLTMPGVSSSGSGELNVGRSLAAGGYQVYYRNTLASASYSIEQARTALVKGIKDIATRVEHQTAGSAIVSVGVPNNLCTSDIVWTIDPAPAAPASGDLTTTIKPRWNANTRACDLEIRTTGTLPSGIWHLTGTSKELLSENHPIKVDAY